MPAVIRIGLDDLNVALGLVVARLYVVHRDLHQLKISATPRAAPPKAPRLRGEIPALFARPAESVTLHLGGNSSPFCSKILALLAVLDVIGSHWSVEGPSEMASELQNEANRHNAENFATLALRAFRATL